MDRAADCTQASPNADACSTGRVQAVIAAS
jgi:hypothetical protein